MVKNVESIIKQLGELCKNHRLTIVTAESCTGGGIAFALSKSMETSAILERGYVTYSTQSKEGLLEVKAETIQLNGAVSKQVAMEMASGALKNSIAQVSLAITGIAGEDNDSAHNKGVAWVAVSIVDSKTFACELTFTGSRLQFVNHVLLKSLAFFLETLTKEFATKTKK
jgi:nicotinamide-nucleotide amidase